MYDVLPPSCPLNSVNTILVLVYFQQIIDAADADGTGTVNFEEFANAMVELGIKILV